MAKINKQKAANDDAELEQLAAEDGIDEDAAEVIGDLDTAYAVARELFKIPEGSQPTPEMVFGVYDRAFAVYEE